MTLNWKELASGFVLIFAGLLYGYVTLDTLPVGSPLNLGPGGFPVVLCGALVVIGLVICARSLFKSEDAEFGVVPWRAIVMLSASILLFGTFLRQLGLFPSVFASAFLASAAERRFKPLPSALIALCLAVLCSLIFIKGIGLPIPFFGSFFSG
jgi:putative tricarboxylic transport membrane protein